MSDRRSTFTFRLLAAVLALPALLAAPSAGANVRTTIPGAACIPDPFWVRDSNATFDVLSDGAIQWHSPSTDANFSFSMFCPITRSLPLSTTGMSDFQIRFRSTTAQSSSATCSVASMRTDGTILLSDGKVQTLPGNSPSVMDLDGINKSVSKGTYMLSCLLPLTVQMISVYHSENDGISGN
jgi:hypothetical protein